MEGGSKGQEGEKEQEGGADDGRTPGREEVSEREWERWQKGGEEEVGGRRGEEGGRREEEEGRGGGGRRERSTMEGLDGVA